MKALPDDAAFNERTSQFVLLQVDTTNGKAKVTRRLGLNRNKTYFLALDAKGNEIARMLGPGPRTRRSSALVQMMDRALKAGKGKPLVQALTELLQHKHHSYRTDAVDALAKQGKRAAGAVPALLPLLADRSGAPTVSWHTTIALRNFGAAAKPAIPLLQRLIADKTRPDHEKQMALSSLGRIDPKGESVLPTLREALKGRGVLAIGAALAIADLGEAAAPLAPDLAAAARRFANGSAHGYLRKALKAIQGKR